MRKSFWRTKGGSTRSAICFPSAAASAVVGGGVVAAYNGINHYRNTAKSRFKKIGVGGTLENPGTIALIRQREKEALEMIEMLKEAPESQKEFEYNGKKFSKRAFKREISEVEDVVYHGLKFVLEEALNLSSKINKLIKKRNTSGLDSSEENALLQAENMRLRIVRCVRYMTENRDDYNPYKNLIVEYLHKGCLLGKDDEENRQIKTHGRPRGPSHRRSPPPSPPRCGPRRGS